MAKIRKSASIENGLMEVIKILTEEEIQAAINKGSSYVRKCSNPDLQQEIDHNDSFKLDKACIAKGKRPPLLTAHEYMVIQEFDKNIKMQEVPMVLRYDLKKGVSKMSVIKTIFQTINLLLKRKFF